MRGATLHIKAKKCTLIKIQMDLLALQQIVQHKTFYKHQAKWKTLLHKVEQLDALHAVAHATNKPHTANRRPKFLFDPNQLSPFSRFHIKLPRSPLWNVKIIHTLVCDKISTAAAPTHIADQVIHHLKITMATRDKIADLTHNHIKWCKKFDTKKPFTCTCKNCAQGKPTQVIAQDIILPKVFQCSSQTTPHPIHTRVYKENLCYLYKQHWVINLFTMDMLDEQLFLHPTQTLHTPTREEVAMSTPTLRKWVVYPIDKNGGETFIECPHAAWQQMKSTYNMDANEYNLVDY